MMADQKLLTQTLPEFASTSGRDFTICDVLHDLAASPLIKRPGFCGGMPGLFEVKAGGAQLAAAASAAATDPLLAFTARRGERSRGLLIRGDGNPEAAHRALSRYAVVPPRAQRPITVEAAPVRHGSPMPLHHPRGQLVEHARAASGGSRGTAGPARQRIRRRAMVSRGVGRDRGRRPGLGGDAA